ncbi:MAG: ABC transporter ATP-binding protein [Acutalibacteraceae bacterium]|nr:ABC transporter ATP-binding protein [Acutalibacteraceae bacterium]
MSVLSLKNICFSYGKTPVLKDLSLEFEKGKIYGIVGKSGAGKTTLLSVLSGLASPDKGEILYNGNDIKKLDKYKFRSKYIGVIFQSFNLITKFTAVENVILSMDIAGVKNVNKKEKAMELLEGVGLDEDEANRRVLHLSGGQQQRVAIARALSYNPDIILADEPTGNLDTDTQQEIMDIFRSLADNGKCVILVTHSPDVASLCDECYELKRVQPQKKKKSTSTLSL